MHLSVAHTDASMPARRVHHHLAAYFSGCRIVSHLASLQGESPADRVYHVAKSERNCSLGGNEFKNRFRSLRSASDRKHEGDRCLPGKRTSRSTSDCADISLFCKSVSRRSSGGTITLISSKRGKNLSILALIVVVVLSPLTSLTFKGDEPMRNWRRGRDLNPRYPLRYVRFRGGSFQPLTHLSAMDRYAIAERKILRLRSGFRQRDRTPANRLNFRRGSSAGSGLQPLTHLSATKKMQRRIPSTLCLRRLTDLFAYPTYRLPAAGEKIPSIIPRNAPQELRCVPPSCDSVADD